MSSESSSPSQTAGAAQGVPPGGGDYFNYFSSSSAAPSGSSSGDLPYYSGRYDSAYVSPYQGLYGPNNGGSGGSSSPYYNPPNPGGFNEHGSNGSNNAFGANYSSYYVAAAAAAAASQYYPPPPPSGGSINYGPSPGAYGTGNVSGSSGTQTIYHLSSTDHVHLSGATGGAGLLEAGPGGNASPEFALEAVSGAKTSGRKSSLNRGRGKPRRNSESPVITNNVNRVFIWDLDETIIIYHSLLTGKYAERNSKDISRLNHLAQNMESLIFNVADNHFFYNDLEDSDQVHIDDVSGDDNGQDLHSYNFAGDGFRGSSGEPYMAGSGIRGGVEWMRKLSFRFRKIKESYNLYRNNVGDLLGSPKQEKWISILEELEIQTNGWYGIALKCLRLISERTNCVNVLVTQTQLVEALTKVLLFRLGPIFAVENLYSAAKVGKSACFDRISQRFGKKNVTYVVIGDGEDEEVAAKSLTYPYWRVSEHKDLDALYNALKLDYI